MSLFLENAQRLFETATTVTGTGESTDYAILVGADGAIRMVAGCDWPLDSLRRERDAQVVYRVSDRNGRVRVEGRSGRQSCLLETERPAAVARRLLAGQPRYLLTNPPLAGTSRILPAASD